MNLKRPLAAALAAWMTTTAPVWAQTGAAAPAPAAAGAPLSAAYAKDLRAIIDALRIFEFLTAANAEPASLSAPERDLMLAFRGQLTRADCYAHIEPVMANALTPARAAELAKLMGLPVFRKREARALAAPGARAGLGDYSDAEVAELRRIDALPAMLEWRAMQPKLKLAVHQAFSDWTARYGEQMVEKAMDVLRRLSADMAAARAAGRMDGVTVGRVGVRFWDQFASLIATSGIRISAASLRLDRELGALGFNDLLEPENLASKARIAHAREVLERAEAALETMLNDVNGAIRDREDGLRSIEFPRKGEYLKSFDREIGQLYAFFVDFGEASRRVLDQYRRVLAFIDERQEGVRLQDGKLVFATDADLAMAREIFSHIGAAAAELQRVVEAQRKREGARMDQAGADKQFPK